MGMARRSIAAAQADGVNQVGLFLIAFLVAATGILILVLSKCSTNFAIATGAILVLAGVTIAVPVHARQARHQATSIIRAVRGGSPTATIPPHVPKE